MQPYGPALAIVARAGAAATGGGAGSAADGGNGAAAVPAIPTPAPGAAAADDPESDGGPFHHPSLPTAPPPGFEGLEPTPPLAESPTTDHFHDLSVDSSAPALLT